MDYQSIGKRIRNSRKTLSLSQEQLAEMIGISPTHMSHIETGSTKLSLPVLIDLSMALHVSCDKLLFDDDDHKNIEIQSLLKNCNESEINIILDTLKSLKESLKKNTFI